MVTVPTVEKHKTTMAENGKGLQASYNAMHKEKKEGGVGNESNIGRERDPSVLSTIVPYRMGFVATF